MNLLYARRSALVLRSLTCATIATATLALATTAAAQPTPDNDASQGAAPETSPPPSATSESSAPGSNTIAARASQAGCDISASATLNDTPVVACTDQRILILHADRIESRRASGPIETLLVSNQELWVITRQQNATLLSNLPSARAADASTQADPQPGSSPDASPPPQRSGKSALESATVVESERGTVLVDMGSEHGLESGQLLELYAIEDVQLGRGSQSTQRTRTLAVAPIQSLSDTHAEVALGLNERVPSGALARATQQEPTTSRFTPPRLPNLSRFTVTLRPFLALGTLGAGSLSEASAAYQFSGPWTAEVLIDPLAVGFSQDASLLALIGTAIVSYDTTPFQVGLGVGTTTVNSTAYGSASSDTGTFGAELGLAMTQKVRLGALDGLHLQIVNNFFLYDGAFRYGGTAGSAQVPAGSIGRSSWIVARGGAGYAGHAFGEVGLKVLARGNGDHGSLFFVPTVGLAQLRGAREVDCFSGPEFPGEDPVPAQDQTCYAQVSQAGPMIGFQIEWRP